MEQIGIVKSINGEYANITVQRLSACGSNCKSCGGGCEIKPVDISVKNELGAKVGDTVELESEPNSIFKILILLYSIPLVFLLFGIGLGMFIFKGRTDMYEIVSFGIGLAFLGLSLLVIKRIDKDFKDKHKLVVLKRII
ncbi:MAG: SoxR reducing system RseC family protein [Tissierellia bacterium]|nr:SoxR reducing system RseC family protein [Tissierellia bacterium]